MRRLSSIVTAVMLLTVMGAYSNAFAPVAVNAVTPILFDFDTGSPAPILRHSTPFDQTVGSMTAHFSSPQDPAAFAIQSQATTTFILSQFSGQYLISNGGQRNTLYISFSQPINNITFTFATIDYHDPGVGGTASPISLTAYVDSATSTPVGSMTAYGAFTSDTYPEGKITLTTPGKTFNLVAVVVPFLQQGAVDFIVDNVIVYPASAIVDATPPVSTLSIRGASGSQGWWKSNIELALTAQDASGVAKIEYNYNNATWSTYTAPFNVTTEGSSSIYYRATDSVGNVEAAKKQAIKIDKTPPTGSIKINNGDASTTSATVGLTLTQADAVSGVSQVRYGNDGVWDTEQWEVPQPTKAWTLTAGTGAKTVYYQVMDNAGLVSATISTSIVLESAPADNVKPVANAGQDVTAIAGVVSFNGGASSDNVGIVSYIWSFGDGTSGSGVTTSHTYSGSGTYTVTLTVKDAAGNSSTDELKVTVNSGSSIGLPPALTLLVAAIGVGLAAAITLRKRA